MGSFSLAGLEKSDVSNKTIDDTLIGKRRKEKIGLIRSINSRAIFCFAWVHIRYSGTKWIMKIKFQR